MILSRIDTAHPGAGKKLDALCARSVIADPETEKIARAIIDDVRARGDAAVRELSERFDGRSPAATGTYEVTGEERRARAAKVSREVRSALERAATRIRTFHREQLAGEATWTAFSSTTKLKSVALARVGIYVPGGTARYPSSVLMTAIPARIAGVGEIIMVTPGASPETLAAAELCGVDRVFEIGGAQAVAALAYGTQSVPRVDKIVGPGNRFVAAAKRLCYGDVDIDSVAGPSEVLIIADDTADPAWVAADLLAQAEHDPEARPILVVLSENLADAVDGELVRQLATLPRRDIAERALRQHGVCVIAAGVEPALAFAEAYAPEHLELCIAGADEAAEHVRSAGAVFVGHFSPEAAGDYVAGPNHVLPTGGAARYASPLGVYDFRKRISILRLGAGDLRPLIADIVALAEVEGLTAHARSAACRANDQTRPDGDDD